MSASEKVKLPHFCAPIDFDVHLDKIISSIYRVGKAATSKEIVAKDNSLGDFVCVGRACSFLSYVGLLEGERSPFALSPIGREIALALEEKNTAAAINLWQQILKRHSLYSQLQKYIAEQGGKRGTPLGFGEHLRKLAQAKWSSNFVREGGKRLCVLFAGKGLLNFDRSEDSISFQQITAPQNETNQQNVSQNASNASPSDLPQHASLVIRNQPASLGLLSYTINVNVEAKDAQSIREVINLIKELKEQKVNSP